MMNHCFGQIINKDNVIGLVGKDTQLPQKLVLRTVRSEHTVWPKPSCFFVNFYEARPVKGKIRLIASTFYPSFHV
jgi:hypothetical protein